MLNPLILSTDELIYSRITSLLEYDGIDDNVDASLGIYMASFPILWDEACSAYYERLYNV